MIRSKVEAIKKELLSLYETVAIMDDKGEKFVEDNFHEHVLLPLKGLSAFASTVEEEIYEKKTGIMKNPKSNCPCGTEAH